MEKIEIHTYPRQLERVQKRIEESKELLHSNKKILLKYSNSLDLDGLSVPRKVKLLGQTLRFSLWINKDLKSAKREDIERIIGRVQQNPKIKDWTKSGYRISIKRFYKWLLGNSEIYPPNVSWIKPKCPRRNQIKESEIFTEQEILKIIDTGCISERDKAIIAIGYECLSRIGEVGSLKVGSITLHDGEGEVCMIGKTGERKMWIRFAIPYLRRWLSVHPLRNSKNFNDEALFVMLGCKNRFNPMTYASYRKVIDSAVKRAGITKRHNPHLLFRVSRATFLSDYLNERQLMAAGGWKDHESVGHYVAEKDTRKVLARVFGGEEEKKKEGSKLAPIECQICKHRNAPNMLECENCHNPISLEHALKRKTELDGLKEQLSQMQQKFDFVLNVLSNPAVSEAIKEVKNKEIAKCANEAFKP